MTKMTLSVATKIATKDPGVVRGSKSSKKGRAHQVYKGKGNIMRASRKVGRSGHSLAVPIPLKASEKLLLPTASGNGGCEALSAAGRLEKVYW